MKPAPFVYHAPQTLEAALALLAEHENARALAGGQSLMPILNFRLAAPEHLVDLNRIDGFSFIREEGNTVVMGAMTRQREIERSPIVAAKLPLLAEAIRHVGHRQTRSRGTLGGSLAHADPSADYPAAMLALDAEIHVKGPRGDRRVKSSQFFKDLFTVDLGADEIIVAISFAPVRSAAYAKLHQRASHYAIVGVAAALEVRGGTIASARVGVTGAGSHAVRLSSVEAVLAGKPATAETCSAAAASAGAEIAYVSGDLHASSEYRKAMIPVFTRRALQGALARI